MPERPKAYRGSEPFVFVSYAHADDKLAYPLIAGLQERGLRIWFDDGMDIGDLWDEVLAKRVKQCSAMLCLVSTRFTDSNNCLDEIHNAKEQKKELLILHLEDEVLPEIFQFRYSRFHALRLSAYSDQGELLDKLAATQKLRCCIGQAQEGVQETTESPEDIFQKGKACDEAKSYEEAVNWYRKAADLGHPEAMRVLGYYYEKGQGIEQSYEEAATWYRRAANLGDAGAMRNLGLCYAYSRGVYQSYEEAVTWYRRAADKGHAIAMCNLGYCYDNGLGVSKSYEEAVKWYRQSAEKGHVTAMRNLGGCYAGGRGVPKDLMKAKYWRDKAKQAEDNASN